MVLADINDSMLKVGREKLRNKGIIGNVSYVQANAESLPFPDDTFDCVTISFGLRNVTEKEQALRSMYRVLKPGGRLLILEFSTPVFKALNKAYDLYSFHILPRIGEMVARDAGQLPLSGRIHPHAPGSGNPENHDARRRFRHRRVLQYDRRYRCAAPRL